VTAAGDSKSSDVLLAGLTDNDGIAFDQDGNLWVGGGATLVRYDAARLADSTADAEDLALTVTAAVGNTAIKADVLAFDKAGNLWGVDEGGNAVFQIAKAALGQTGDKAVKANVSFVVGVTALPSTPAFDDGNGLWLALESGRFGRFSPAQLGMSAGGGTPVTPAVVIDSGSVGAGLPVAFFPAPVGLPLFHSIPAP
jgi:streptogramin lyase